ncbi:tetratricopeptide repeat protein [Oligoflexaceae bacterium]|nr:tetratricopeptide repeat protein [Oligoflexaceae bacterium]
MSCSRVCLFQCIAISAVVFSIYLTDIFASHFVFDDSHFIVNNLFHQSWSHFFDYFTQNSMAGAGKTTNFYRPLQLLTHKLDVTVWGMNASGHLFTSILIFTAMNLAIYLLIARLLGKTKSGMWAAFLATILYAVHPLHCADTAFLSGRSGMLVVLFGCLTLLTLERHFIICFICFALALFSKESAIVWPFMAMGYGWITTGKLKNFLLPKQLALILLTCIYITCRLTILDFDNTLNFSNNASLLSENISYRIFTWFSTLAKGWQLVFFPHDIHHLRAWPVHTDWLNLQVLLGMVSFLTCVTGAFYFRRKSKIVALGLLWIIVATLPTSNMFALINSVFLDHWFLSSLLGFCLVLAGLLHMHLNSSLGISRKKIFKVSAGAAVLALVLISVTVQQVRLWRSSASLFSHILKHEPQSITARVQLGIDFNNRGEVAKAKAMYLEAIAIDDVSPEVRHNLGLIYLKEDNFYEAVEQFRKSIEIDPSFFHSYYWMGRIFANAGQYDLARKAYEHCLAIFDDPRAIKAMRELDYKKQP